MTNSTAQLWLITEVETTETVTVQREDIQRGERNSDDIGGSFGSPRPTETIKTTVRQRVPLDAAALKTQMQGLLQVVGEVFEQAGQVSGLQLDEVELSVEINAEGQVSIFGSGGKLADKGAIKLTFKRG